MNIGTGAKVGIAAGAFGVVAVGAGITYALAHRDKTPDPNDAWHGQEQFDSHWAELEAEESGLWTMHGSTDSGSGNWNVMYNGVRVPQIEGTSTDSGMTAKFNYGNGYDQTITESHQLTATRADDGSLKGRIVAPVTVGDVDANGNPVLRDTTSIKATFDAKQTGTDAWTGAVHRAGAGDVAISGTSVGDTWNIALDFPDSDGDDNVSKYGGEGHLSVNQAVAMAVNLSV